MNAYNAELREIRRKSRLVYSKKGIYPFLGSSLGEGNNYHRGEIPGFQIFSLWGKIADDLEEISEKGVDDEP